MTRRNPVAKHSPKFNRAATHKDRSKEPPEFDQEDLDYDDFTVCPHCNSEQYKGQAHLGGLGNTNHYRCRYCGGQWSES